MKLLAVVLGLCAVAATSPTTLAPMRNEGVANVVQDAYLVGLAKGAVGISSTTLDAGVTVIKQFQIGTWRALYVHADIDALLALRKDPSVTYVEVDAWTAQLDDCIEQESGSRIWGLSRVSHRDIPENFTQAKYSYLDDAQTGEGVDAYIVDTGILLEHVDFNGRAVWGMTASAHQNEGDVDLNGHGTHVAGTIGSTTYGVAK
jgi:subtilisin family serine protease